MSQKLQKTMKEFKTIDIITFIEQYCLFNGKHIKLNDSQKNLSNG